MRQWLAICEIFSAKKCKNCLFWSKSPNKESKFGCCIIRPTGKNPTTCNDFGCSEWSWDGFAKKVVKDIARR